MCEKKLVVDRLGRVKPLSNNGVEEKLVRIEKKIDDLHNMIRLYSKEFITWGNQVEALTLIKKEREDYES